jgi:hypothetical protein
LFVSKQNSDIRITAEPAEMTGGLFGEVLLWVFEILPYLHERHIFPDWRIRAAYYGRASDGLVIPGVLDLAYEVVPGPKKEISLVQLHGHRRRLLGNDWQGLSALWHAYFRIPDRIINRAKTFGSFSDVVGIHYRGNDKQTAFYDSNPVSHDDYLAIIRQFCQERPEFKRIFVATDDLNFFRFLKSNISLEVINCGDGGVGFHLEQTSPELVDVKTDRAMLDCVLLSRCGAVLLNSSALSSFAKIINPQLEIYRVAASKFFANTPYFPVAYIPIYSSSSSEIATLIDRLMVGDWTKTAHSEAFTAPFVSRPYWSPTLRLVYSHVRRLPGFNWVSKLPDFLAAHRRRRRLRVQQR